MPGSTKEYKDIPRVEWAIYKDITGMTKEEIWHRAASTRSPEAIFRLVELLTGLKAAPLSGAARHEFTIAVGDLFVPKLQLLMAAQETRVLVMVTARTPKKREPFEVTYREMMGVRSKPQYDEKQVLFLLPSREKR